MGVKDHDHIVCAWPNSLHIKCYTRNQIHAISVKEVTNSNIETREGETIDGGVYDLAFGPLRRNEACVTCGLNGYHCPGHSGHINLAAPCFNPLFFTELKQLLNSTCNGCSHFLCTANREIYFEARLEALTFDSLKCFHEISGLQSLLEEESDIRELCDRILKKFKNKPSTSSNRSKAALRSQVVTEFFKLCSRKIKKCPRCEGAIPEYKYESSDQTKIYLETMSIPSIDTTESSQDEDDKFIECIGEEPNKEDGDEFSKNNEEEKDKLQYESVLIRVPALKCLKHIKTVFKTSKRLMRLLYPGQKSELFFIETILIPPTKFRPMNKVNDRVTPSDRTAALRKIVAASEQMKWLQGYMTDADETAIDENKKIQIFLSTVTGDTLSKKYENLQCELQTLVNIMIDSSKERQVRETEKVPGAKQRLEKKNGLFRMNIMGKRVNFCARTVITPDPNINTSQLGVPEWIAKKLTYPEAVTEYNYHELRKAIHNGPNVHPGATAILHEDGKLERLNPHSRQARTAVADQLLTSFIDRQGLTTMKKVVRHMRNGDAVIANRQPTLHKGSIMAHRAKITKGEYTFRLHYSNCKHYNADFDGDEMNMHLPQTEEARAEAELLMSTDLLFRSAKDGYPLAGLIQDHIIAGVSMTLRGRFFTEVEYQDLVFSSLSETMRNRRIKLQPPSIMKPKVLWSGKQIISTLIQNLCGAGGLVFQGKCKVTAKNLIQSVKKNYSWSNDLTDATMHVRQGYVCTGVFDKAHVGPGKYGIVAAIEELYGGPTAGAAISGFAKMFTHFLRNYRGFTLGIKDIATDREARAEKKLILRKRRDDSLKDIVTHFKLKKKRNVVETSNLDEAARKVFRSAHLVGTEVEIKEIDSVLKQTANKMTQQIHNSSINHLKYRFPCNNLEFMIMVGAKGSQANLLNMVSSLGQVELDGKRAPLMPSGRSLPYSTPYDYDVRAGAFIGNCYASGGLRPQEFFFHCMAGRDGLIDTSCKTASSGYLQRCLIKHLEGVVVAYDRTVRDHDNTIIQFQFGEDGLDISKTPYLNRNQFSFIADNFGVYKSKYYGEKTITGISAEVKHIQKKKERFVNRMIKNNWKERNIAGNERVEAFNDFINTHEKLIKYQNYISTIKDQEQRRSQSMQFSDIAVKVWHPVAKPGEDASNIASIFPDESPMTEELREKWINKRRLPDPQLSSLSPDLHVGSTGENFYASVMKYVCHNPELTREVKDLLFEKYRRSLIDPGDHVGLVVSQSIGEPSTQMTLNTFHLAGKADVNITLGIPRLRELLMTAPLEVKTPMMAVPFHPHVSKQMAKEFVKSIRNIVLSDVVTNITACEKLKVTETGNLMLTSVKIKIGTRLCENYGLTPATILKDHIERDMFRVFKNKLQAYGKAHEKDRLIMHNKPQENTQEVPEQNTEEKENVSDSNEDNEDNNPDAEVEEYGDSGIDDEGENEEDALEDASVSENEEESGKPPGFDLTLDNIDEKFNEISNAHVGDVDSLQEKDERKERIKKILTSNKQIKSYTFENNGGWCSFVIQRKTESERLDLVKVLANAIKTIKVQGLHNVTKVTMKELESGNGFELLTEGINFGAVYNYTKLLDLNKLSTNDVNSFAETYGVEAGAMTIKKEIDKVFKPYGIEIDKRHTSLIADYMTQEGGYRPFSRYGLGTCASPIQKASYETTSQFLVSSILKSEIDDISSPSARIATGQLFRGGTNYFDLRQKIMF